MKEAVQAYFDEASWFYDEYTPTLEDYMSIADVSCAYPFIIKTSFLGVGEIATKEVFDWAFDKPKIIKATSAIGRIMNDIVSHKVGSYIFSHMPNLHLLHKSSNELSPISMP